MTSCMMLLFVVNINSTRSVKNVSGILIMIIKVVIFILDTFNEI